ncbi:MAG: hypothetical protein ACKV0T_00375 [Planctomycetales bacterium]
MPSRRHPLDDLLPLLQPGGLDLHLGATLLEVSEMSQVAELASTPKIRRLLLARVSDTVALVDPLRARELQGVLMAAGHTPRVAENESK